MSGRLAILCPGQGGQHAGMFAWARADRRVAAQMEQWELDALVGAPVEQILDQPEALFANRYAQPLIVAASLAAWEAIREHIPQPAVAAGYSVGEMSAYAVNQALTGRDAIRLTAHRAQYMDECIQAGASQGMLAVTGVALGALTELASRHGAFIAIETAEDSAIVGGWSRCLNELAQALNQAHRPALRFLPVHIASHTPLMQAAAARFMEDLNGSGMTAPAFPVVAGISGEMVNGAGQACSSLARQLTETVKWNDCMTALAEYGVTTVVELGPGNALSRMFHARFPDIECRSVTDFHSTDGLLRWLQRQVG